MKGVQDFYILSYEAASKINSMVHERKIFFVGICFWAFVFGILFGFYRPWSEIFLGAWLCSGLTIFFIGQKKYRFFFILSSFCMGLVVMQGHQWLYQQHRISIARAEKILATIIDIQSIADKKWLQIYVLKIDSIDDQILWLSGYVRCTISKSAQYQEGDYILITKESKKIHFHQKKEFDLYLAKEQLWGWLYLKPEHCFLIHHNQTMLQGYFLNMRQNVKTLYQSLQEPARTLYGALFLGIDKVLPQDPLKHVFNYWGIIHYLARSGLHIMLFVFLWKTIFYYFFGRKRNWIYFVAPFIFVYVLVTPGTVSFMRGVWSFLLLMMALLMQRPYHLPHLLVTLAALFLFYNPYILFFLDFQLSFGLTYTLLALQEAFYALYIQNKIKKNLYQ